MQSESPSTFGIILNKNLIGLLHSNVLSIASIALFFTIILFSPKAYSQNETFEFEEISVFLLIQNVGGFEMPVYIRDEEIYIPVSELFNALKVNKRAGDFNDTIKGFYLTENNLYEINRSKQEIKVGDKTFKLSQDEIINTDSYGIALKLSAYEKAFELKCKFYFNSLTIELKTNLELPIVKEMRLEQMRKNINKLMGQTKVDTTLKRKYHLIRGGMLDWAVYSTQTLGKDNETRGLLAIGTEFLGGETNIQLNFSDKEKFNENQQQYKWRWVNNNTKIVKQITAGKITQRSIASIYSPTIGFTLTNTPSTFRRSFGSYTINDYTEPGWQVELYINNVIVDYVTADASGFFTFNIPLVYGASNVLLKFYGPWGEERQKEQTINVPYYFLPKGSIEYNIGGGIVQDKEHSQFGRAEIGYGVNKNLTVGAGYEHLSSIKSGAGIPFVYGAATFLSNFILSSEFAYNVRSKSLLSFRLPSNLSIDLDYTKYAKEQKAISFNYLEERRLGISIPININKFKAYSRLAFRQNVLKETTYSTAEASLSTFVKGFSTNITGYANWLSEGNPYIYSNIAFGYRFFRTLSVRPQMQYDFTNHQLINIKVELENSFSQNLHMAFTWDDNVRYGSSSFDFSIRYNFAFAQTSANTRISKNFSQLGQSARGSIALGTGNRRIHISDRSMTGKAGLTIVPYLDVNNNNKKDSNEPMVSGLNMGINGGRILAETKDSIIRITELEPFAAYLLEFSDTQFENIAWQLKDKTISVMIDPNQFKLVEIPIKVLGEINGYVFIQSGKKFKGQGRILVNIFNEQHKLVHKCLTEPDGYYSFIGLAPGAYYACIDSTQLGWISCSSSPEKFEFEILPTETGDIIDNIEFKLKSTKTEAIIEATPTELKPVDPVQNNEIKKTLQPEKDSNLIKNDSIKSSTLPKNNIKKTEIKLEQPPAVSKNINAPKANIENSNYTFFLQLGAYKKESNANTLVTELRIKYNDDWKTIEEDGLYKVRLDGLKSVVEAKQKVKIMKLKSGTYYIGKRLIE